MAKLRVRRPPPPAEPEKTTGRPQRARVRARSPVAWLRGALLFLFVLSLAGIGLLLAAYRFGRLAPESETAEQPADPFVSSESGVTAPGPPPPPQEESLLSGVGFDHTQTSAGEKVFRIRAEKSRQDRSGNVELSRVVLDIFRTDGQVYSVTSERATFSEKTWQARLAGSVVLRGWGDLEVEARALELHDEGKVLTSSGDVRFRYPPDLTGRAANLRVDRRNDTVTLGGGVHIHTTENAEEPMRLNCERVVYQRSGALLRAVGEVLLEGETTRLEGHYVTLFLSDDQKEIDTIRARWNVKGRMTSEDVYGGETVVEFQGEFLDMGPENRGMKRIKLDGEGGEVMMKVTDPEGVSRTLTGLYLHGEMRNERLTQVEGVGEPMIIAETLDLDPPYNLRQLCAGRARARFLPSGGVGTIELDRQVELNDRQATLTGGRKATLNIADGLFRIDGRGDTVELLTDRAEVRAKQYTFANRTGLIRAYGGVRAVLAENAVGALSSTPLGQARGPVQVEASEAYWTAVPPTFNFDGDVRAWRGESLLLAEQLRGDEATEELSASGAVRTVWVADEGLANDTAQPREPIEVSAEYLSYLQNKGQLIYNQGVELRQGLRTLNCQELAVDLIDGSQVDQMICTEEVRLVDGATGDRALGDRAVYKLAQETLEIFGEEVQLYDAGNNEMKGRYLVYDLASGTVNMRSNLPDPGEAGAR